MVMGVKHILKKNTQYYNEKIEIPNKEKIIIENVILS